MDTHEFEKCVANAEKAFSQQRYDKALKFIKMAKRMKPDDGVLDEKIKKYEDAEKTANSSEIPHRRRSKTPPPPPPQSSSNNNGSSATSSYTQEQVKQVEVAKKCSDYYELLEVSRNASDAELKKGYKKMALRFHPDKNKAPGSSEVFKTISQAYTVLSNPDKKRQYDQLGANINAYNNHSSPFTRASSNNRHYEDELSPEELFAQFFGTMAMNHMSFGGGFGFPGVRVYTTGFGGGGHPFRRTRTRRNSNSTDERMHAKSFLIQMLPIIIFIAVSLVSYLLTPNPVYSFSSSSTYSVRKQTKSCKTPYYVEPGFSKNYRGFQLKEIEKEIDTKFLLHLREECHNQRRTKDNLIMSARLFGNQKNIERAESFATPTCGIMQSVEKLYNQGYS